MKISATGVVVTGGASGIGRAVAMAMAEKGARVAIFDLNEAAGNEVAQNLGRGALSAKVNVAEKALCPPASPRP
jgi:3-hydroxyacyl-CoA dehydrogenase / 3-hydroxy-2-methylbutyryl-CoA dehydrogenase